MAGRRDFVAGLGRKNTKKERVKWHELKTGVFYLHEQAARTEGGRGMIAEKTSCVGKASLWNLGGACTGRRVAEDWASEEQAGAG